MFGKHFAWNPETRAVIAAIGGNMPGGFFIFRAGGDGELLYANRAVHDLFGCRDEEEFRALTGFTLRGMVHLDDYPAVLAALAEKTADNVDHVEYRIVRRDGAIRWVDDHGHYTETESYGGIYYVFISDITEMREHTEADAAVRQAVIGALSDAYHTVWLIRDTETELFSLYRGDLGGESPHSAPIRAAHERMKYSQAKKQYIESTVAPADRERLCGELELSNITARLRETSHYSVNYLRAMEDGSERYYRIEFAKVDMPGGKMGVVCGFKDVDEDMRA